MTEVATASVILFIVLWATVGALLVAMCVVDVRERRIPNKLLVAVCAVWVFMQAEVHLFATTAAFPLAKAAQACGVPEPLLHLFALPSPLTGVLIAIATVVLLAAVGAVSERLFRTQAMGAGDVKLIAVFALFLGPVPTIVCVMLACAFALVAALPMHMRTFPFAPALALAFACVILVEL